MAFRKLLLSIVALGLTTSICREVQAAPDAGVVSGDTVIFSGDQSDGISSGVDFQTPPITTLIVDSLSGPIAPPSGTTGISFHNDQGASVTVNSGSAATNVIINTSGADAVGIEAVSEGSPAGYQWLPGLGVEAPSGPSGSGGPVVVVNHGAISTDGPNAHGIVAQNNIGSYSEESTSSLAAFSMSDVDISLTSVAGSVGNIGTAVSGDNGGRFTLHSDGTWDFEASDLDAVLSVGDTVVTKVDYAVDILHVPATAPYGSQASGGSFAMHVTKTGAGTFEVEPAIYFGEFDQFSDPAGAAPLWPELQSYVDGLLGDMGVANAGEAISVTNAGVISTHEINSHGIYARSEGGRGSNGTSGTFWNANQLPTQGGAGSNGGAITVVNDGSISTYASYTSGIAIESQGGTGGNGGNGGPWRFGAQGGAGGTGGDIWVQGSGPINIFGSESRGINVMSAGGVGGPGGSGSGVTGGGTGGPGGEGGNVFVEGTWDITNTGVYDAHGIWAKSLGGSAAAGGSGGWLFGSPGTGGNSSDGGSVTVTSGGMITTEGEDSYGIYGESIGGFGGSGGNTFGLFWAFGGDGGSAGSGGDVQITNQASGDIVTQGEESHGVFAQSIGGGGGSGGGEWALIYSLGGEGESGGFGGGVDVSNEGSILTFGDSARGIFGQSIGGGGGDGDWSGSLVAIGGSGSEASDGGEVTVNNSGTVGTAGDEADGIFVQSIGGGGETLALQVVWSP